MKNNEICSDRDVWSTTQRAKGLMAIISWNETIDQLAMEDSKLLVWSRDEKGRWSCPKNHHDD